MSQIRQAVSQLFKLLNLGSVPYIQPGVALFLPAVLLLTVNSWVTIQCTIDLITNPEIPLLFNSFDFVIIGGGGAGMVLAKRLTEGTSHSVLVLDAGGEPCPLNDIPGLALGLVNQPANTFQYPQVTQPNACSLCDNQAPTTIRGKMLGGSTQVNQMLYVRGNKGDYDNWAQMANDNNWNWDNVFPVFKTLETYSGTVNDPGYHGTTGPLSVTTYNWHPGQTEFLNAAQELGYIMGDYNGANQTVFGPVQATITPAGFRGSTYRAYIKENGGVPSTLSIRSFAQVTKINFNANKKAVSVSYIRQGLLRTVTAKKEIILAAGALSSPQLLMLSGVGPAEQLTANGIPVVYDSPQVGNNLRDHPMALIGPFLHANVTNPTDMSPSAVAAFVTGDGGILASSGASAMGFMKSSQSTNDYPDVQLNQFTFHVYNGLGLALGSVFGYNSDKMNQWFKNIARLGVHFVGVVPVRPQSSGTLTLVNDDPDTPPRIDPQYLSSTSDQQAMLEGAKLAVAMYNTSSLGYTKLAANATVPGCESIDIGTDDYLRCLIKATATTLFHHVGTCAMGSVVDSQLRVIGVTGLRVVDTSAIPFLPSGNTQAATIMLAEKAAVIIKSSYPRLSDFGKKTPH